MRIFLLLIVVAYYATSFNAVIADRDFGSKFFKAVAEDASGNMVCSSLGVDVLLSLMTSGARQWTRWQMRHVFQTNDKRHALRVKDFLSKVDGFKEIVLHAANNIFLANRYKLNTNFKKYMREFHITSTVSIDFGNQTAASKIINEWCAANTNNRIKDLISPSSLNPATSMVLVNAIYFKGSWLYPFDVAETKSRAFTVNGTSTAVPTMHIINHLRYGKLPKIKASYVEVPYVSDNALCEISMYVILPDEVNGFEELKTNLDRVTVYQLVRNAKDYIVDLFLPKFKIETSKNLTRPLLNMGLGVMFDAHADFTGIVGNGRSNGVQFFQKAFTGVTETGTEAADATSASSYQGFAVDEASLTSITFDVNRPFVSIVAVKGLGALLSAIIVDPQTE